jgi:hypothetical protein
VRLALIAAGLVCALVPDAFAQRNLNPIGNNGNILNPGIPLTGSAQSGPRTVGPGGRSAGRRSSGGGTLLVPYPVYTDPFYSGYSTVHNPPPGVYDPIFGGYTSPYAIAPGYAPPPASPTVIINQNFQTDTIRPQFRDYSNVPLPEPGVTLAPPVPPAPPDAAAAPSTPLADDQPTIFLIALQDQTVLAAIAYWVQGDTLHYITLKGAQNTVSLSLVDRDLSKQLNGERHIPFRLPALR